MMISQMVQELLCRQTNGRCRDWNLEDVRPPHTHCSAIFRPQLAALKKNKNFTMLSLMVEELQTDT